MEEKIELGRRALDITQPLERQIFIEADTAQNLLLTKEEKKFLGELSEYAGIPTDHGYLKSHLRRFYKSFITIKELAKDVKPNDVIIDAGTWSGYVPVLQKIFPNNRIICISDMKSYRGKKSKNLEFHDLNLEKDPLPLKDGEAGVVLLMETIEHFSTDPMFFLSEANRVLRNGGKLFVTTPNMNSWRALGAVLTGYSPYTFGSYAVSAASSIHCHEYTPRELDTILDYAGFKPKTWTDNVYSEGIPALFERFFNVFQLNKDIREDCLFSIGEKVGPVKERYPEAVYIPG